MGLFSRQIKVSVDEKKIDELLSRGVQEAIVKESLRKQLLSGKRLRVKFGIDPTSPDLHLGRAIPLLKLRDFQELGHQVVFIVGDFTALIGDTSDKDAERPMLSRETIEKNERTYKGQVGRIIDLSSAHFRYNSEWLEPLRYGQIGEQADAFSVADFIARDNIKRRMTAGGRVSLREVLYPLMQGYDSVAVGADVELGGMDQKFNLLSGRTLQEKYAQRPQNILMNPLIDGLDGRKMSSSWGNTIPLTASPAEMFGKVMSMRDDQIKTYFELCTRVSMREIDAVMTSPPRDAKFSLAGHIVGLYHGAEASHAAQKEFTSVFSKNAAPAGAPEIFVAKGTPLRDALKTVVESTSELRRLVSAGAISEVGDAAEVFSDISTPLNRPLILRIGKHRFVKITLK